MTKWPAPSGYPARSANIYHIPEDVPEDRRCQLAQPITEIKPPITAGKATSRSSHADLSDTESDKLHLQPSANTVDVSVFQQAHFRLMRDPSLGEGTLLRLYRPDDTTVGKSGSRSETA